MTIRFKNKSLETLEAVTHTPIIYIIKKDKYKHRAILPYVFLAKSAKSIWLRIVFLRI